MLREPQCHLSACRSVGGAAAASGGGDEDAVAMERRVHAAMEARLADMAAALKQRSVHAFVCPLSVINNSCLKNSTLVCARALGSNRCNVSECECV